MDAGRYSIYWGWDVVITKRLSHKWMFNASFTYQMEKNYYGSKGYLDPTGIWAYEGMMYGMGQDGGYTLTNGGYNLTNTSNAFSRFLLKISALYQLPLDVNVSATLSAHEGMFVNESFSVQDLTLPNSRSTGATMPAVSYDNHSRLGNVWLINAKLEKMIRLGDISRMYFCAELFNAANAHPILGQYSKNLGTFRFAGNGSTAVSLRTPPATTAGAYTEIMNPMVLRLGLRFEL